MGTKAFMSVAADATAEHVYKTIIGMTSDGFPENLEDIARQYLKFKQENPGKSHAEIAEMVCATDKEWLFTDLRENVQWISYSACLNPFTGSLTITDEMDSDEEDTIVQLVPAVQ